MIQIVLNEVPGFAQIMFLVVFFVQLYRNVGAYWIRQPADCSPRLSDMSARGSVASGICR